MDKQTKKLVKSCVKGNSKSQKQLYELHKRQLFGVCLRYANTREEAEDLLQDSFIQIFSKIHKYKPTGAIGAWMRRVTINTCLQHIRRQKDIYFYDIDEYTDAYIVENDVFSELGKKELVRMIQQLPK